MKERVRRRLRKETRTRESETNNTTSAFCAWFVCSLEICMQSMMMR